MFIIKEWRTIPSQPNYEVSSEGEVRNKKTGKLRKLIVSKRGYHVVRFTDTTPKRLCRLMAEAFFGPSDLIVDHIDGDRLNDNIGNLRYTTHETNNLNRKGRTSPPKWDPTFEEYV